MPYLSPDHVDEYMQRGTLAAALERWVALVEAAGADGLDSAPERHDEYARELGITKSEFYTVLKLAVAANRVAEVQPVVGPREAGTKEDAAAGLSRLGLVTP